MFESPRVHLKKMADFPEYVIRPHVIRSVVPQIIFTIVLATVFYVGIALNVYLLNISIPTSINILIIIVLVLLIIIQVLLTYLQTSKTRYSIYKNRIQIEGVKQEYVMFNSIQEIKMKRGFFDRMFNTGTIIIEPSKLKITSIPDFNQTMAYLNQMVQYSRMQYIRQ